MDRVMKQGWYVLYVRSSQEKKVYRDLLENAVESFLPLIKSVRQWSDRKKTILKPLFPSYLFVNIKSKLDFHKVLSMDAACSFLKFGKDYGRISEKEIEQIKLIVNEEEFEDITIANEIPVVGDTYEIMHGSLSGLECEVFRVDSKNRINVRLNSLRQNISATIPANYLQGSGFHVA